MNGRLAVTKMHQHVMKHLILDKMPVTQDFFNLQT